MAKIPVTLDRRQRLFIDAIRYAIAMLDLSYQCLHKLLVQVSYEELNASVEDSGPDMDLVFPLAFADAFTIVDQANRLWTLVRDMPRLKRTPHVQLFLRNMSKAEDMRNPVQHLSGELNRLAGTDEATWGWLMWIYVADHSGVFQVFMALPGTLGPEKISPVTEGPQGVFRLPVDQIELSAYGHKLSLTELYDAVAEFTPAFEETLRNAFADKPHGLSDILVRVEGHTETPPGDPDKQGA